MKKNSRWINEFRKNLHKLNTNPQINRVKHEANSLSEQIQKSFNNQMNNLPQYKSQLKSSYSTVKHKSNELNTQFQQKFHEFSQSNPKFKHYHNQYQRKVNQISQNIPNIPNIPHFNIKKSINSTVKQTAKISKNVQSSAKQISDTSQKMTSSITSSVSKVASIPSSMSMSATKSMKSTYKMTTKLLNPHRFTSKFSGLLHKLKHYILIYGFIGITSLMVVNQWTYMGLVYMIRHRYDDNNDTDNNKMTIFGMDMRWIYDWLNIPSYIDEERKELLKIQDIQMQDYNVQVDVRLAKMAYNGLLYPRIGGAILLTFVIGTPVLRFVRYFVK